MNFLASFQKVMLVILHSAKQRFCLFYLDDIVSFYEPPLYLTGKVMRVLQLPYEAGVALKLKDCSIFAGTVD